MKNLLWSHPFTVASGTQLRSYFFLLTVLLLLASPAWAGPMEDAAAANGRGDYAAEACSRSLAPATLDAEFLFFGWDKDIRRNTKQVIVVQKATMLTPALQWYVR